MKYIPGGVAAPIGFKAAGIHCGVKQNPDGTAATPNKKDLAMILSERDCVTAAVYTKNQVKAAPIHLSQKHLANGHARGIIANSGNANACAPSGMENALRMAKAAGSASHLSPEDFAVASTGIIGVPLNIDAIEQSIPQLASELSDQGSTSAANAILTTDTTIKEVAVTIQIGEKPVTIGAIAKGSGMIHPNMGTMLCFVTTDCVIDGALLQEILGQIVKKTFNRVSVDGDTSTNDCCIVLANGMAQNPPVEKNSKAYQKFCQSLHSVLEYEAKKIAGDGEGAERLIACTVKNAATEEKAEHMAKAVISSSLVKTAMFGADANWGRVLCALGYSGSVFDPERVSVSFFSNAGVIDVCREGTGLSFNEELAKQILSEREITILVDIEEGSSFATCWGCDLTYEYVKINGDYRN